MLETQVDLKESIKHNWERFKEKMPDIGRAYQELPGEVYKDGALSAKTKRLMSIAIAVASGCRGCMLYQTEHALNAGCSSEEILEACAVAISMGGTMAAAETTRVVQYLVELGKL
ncbi:MAG: Alkylhydroperoxidase like protein, AhpD family [Clostridia bacterium 62_21]|nr:MAG: Alkylhydroperoxidase like protein, AhpD family [Clostridia bacterium 62_21]HAG06755.1 alkylhydroperoxidase [Peptococcaceae bacterium]